MAEIIVVGVVVLAMIAALVALSLKAMSATIAAADARVNAQRLEGELAIAKATIATKTDEATNERTRANALDDALANAESTGGGDPATALDRLLSQWRAARAGSAAVGSSSKVLTPPATGPGAVADPGLLKPGE